jgi:hypothetical protein
MSHIALGTFDVPCPSCDRPHLELRFAASRPGAGDEVVLHARGGAWQIEVPGAPPETLAQVLADIQGAAVKTR